MKISQNMVLYSNVNKPLHNVKQTGFSDQMDIAASFGIF